MSSKIDRTGPPVLPGICSTCGYTEHPEGLCAVWPCYRCLHRATPGMTGPRGWKMRSDGSRGYLPAEYRACECSCHKRWRAAYEALEDTSPAVTVEAVKAAERIEAVEALALPRAAPSEHDWS